jgi:SnoaL-like domain
MEASLKNLLIGACVLTLLASSPLAARAAAPEDSLKLAHGTLVSSILQGNLAMAQGLVHQNALGFFWDSQMLAEIKPEFTPAQALTPIIADLGRFTSTNSATTYRVVGDTGIVCMTSVRVPTKEAKKEDSKLQTAYYRLTYTYVRDGGNWRLLTWHTSQTPLVKK